MNILILGGYGNVGSVIATTLIEHTDSRVIVAGRRIAQAEQLASKLGDRAVPRKVDATFQEDYDVALADVHAVVACFDLPEDGFVRACLERGIHYVDISAESEVLSRIEVLDDLAKAHNASVLIGLGLIPGISNLMVKRGLEQIGEARRVDNIALLGLGEAFGPASADWTLKHYGDRYDRNRLRVDLGERFGKRTVYRFAFADQTIIPRTLHVLEAASWVCYDRVSSTHFIGLIRLVRLGWLFRNPTVRRWLIRRIQKMQYGSDVCALKTQITGMQPGQHYHALLTGRGEAELTALVASEAARLFFADLPLAGIYHIEQLFELETFLPLLSQKGTVFEDSSP